MEDNGDEIIHLKDPVCLKTSGTSPILKLTGDHCKWHSALN